MSRRFSKFPCLASQITHALAPVATAVRSAQAAAALSVAAVSTVLLSGCATLPTAATVSYEARAPELPLTVIVNDKCAGVVVGPEHVMTAGHCIEGVKEVPIQLLGSQRRVAARVHHRDYLRDVAILETSTTFDRWATIRNPEVGEPARLVHPVRPERSYQVEAISFLWSEAAMDGTVSHGDSGSPVFGKDGALLGICISYEARAPHRGIVALVADLSPVEPERKRPEVLIESLHAELSRDHRRPLRDLVDETIEGARTSVSATHWSE